MKRSILVAAMVVAITANAEDMRPPFDKSDYKGTVAVQVNLWFPLDKPAADAYGGPNIPWIRFGSDVWKNGMELCAEYGVTAFVPSESPTNLRPWREGDASTMAFVKLT